jgi:hypothetical protein
MSVPDPISMMDDQLVVFSVSFGPDGIEIDFLDPRRQSRGMNEITKLGVDRTLMADEIESLEEQVRDLIDEALSTRRK